MSLTRRARSQTITRPADTAAYTAGDLVANSTTAGVVTPFLWDFANMSQMGIQSAVLHKSTNATAGGTFRLWLFSVAKDVANGDNGPVLPTTMNGFLGTMSTSPDVPFAGGIDAATPLSVDIQGRIWPNCGKIWGLLEATGAYAPGNAEMFFIELVLADEGR